MYGQACSKVARYAASLCRGFLVYAGALGAALAPATLGFETGLPDTRPECLATAVHYEARGEPLKGQRAVVDVIMHRAWKSGKSICEVLTQKQQFQWTKRHGMRYDVDTLERLEQVMQEPKVLKNENFLYFHSTAVKPPWARKMECSRIGHHNFCKEGAKP